MNCDGEYCIGALGDMNITNTDVAFQHWFNVGKHAYRPYRNTQQTYNGVAELGYEKNAAAYAAFKLGWETARGIHQD